MRQFHCFKPSGALLCYDLDEIWDALEGLKLVWTTVSLFQALLWFVVDKSFDDLEGKELICATVGRFSAVSGAFML